MEVCKTIAFFGAGKIGELSLSHVHLLQQKVECIVDNDSSKWGSELEGITIHPPEHLLTLGDNLEIIVTMDNQNDVISQLQTMDFVNGKHIVPYKEKVYTSTLKLGSLINGTVIFKPIIEELSSGYKYYIETEHGSRYFLRFSESITLADIDMEIRVSRNIASIGVNVPSPLDYGEIQGRTFFLSKWIDGKCLPDVLGQSTYLEQYEYGLKAGGVLKKIHDIPVPQSSSQSTSSRICNGLLMEKFKLYNEDEMSLHYADRMLIRKHKESAHVVNVQPDCFLHGDYHTDNIIVIYNSYSNSVQSADLAVIDFEAHCCHALEADFSAIIGDGHGFPLFSTGVLHGYFNGEPPEDFWPISNRYVFERMLSLADRRKSIMQNILIPFATEYKSRVLSGYSDAIDNEIPYWYLPVSHVQNLKFMEFYQKVHSEYYSREEGFCPDIFYEGYESLHIYGLRPTEYRFSTYGLGAILSTEQSVLDIACNCGFMSIYASQYVKTVIGVELEQSLVHIANATAEYLGVTNCNFICQDFNHFSSNKKFDVIFSFAAHHWLGVPMEEYVEKLTGLLNDDGIVLLESHTLDLGMDQDFSEIVQELSANDFKVISEGDIADNLVRPRKFKIFKLFR